jgi:hypothetical protein
VTTLFANHGPTNHVAQKTVPLDSSHSPKTSLGQIPNVLQTSTTTAPQNRMFTDMLARERDDLNRSLFKLTHLFSLSVAKLYL